MDFPYFRNDEQSLKLLQDITIPYMRKERERLGLDISHPGLLIMDVFRGQKNATVRNLLPSRDICFSKVPANMADLYQPPNLTVNGYAKAFIKRMKGCPQNGLPHKFQKLLKLVKHKKILI